MAGSSRGRKSLLSKKSKETGGHESVLKNSASVRKRAARPLNTEDAQRYRDIMENIADGYFEVDLAGNFTFFNDAVCRVLGYTKEELQGMDSRQVNSKDDHKKVFQAYNKVYKTGKPLKAFCWRIIRKDGAERYIEGSISLRKDSSDRPIGFRGIANDVTERRQTEDKLRAEEQRFRTLAEQSSDIIILVNRSGKENSGI